MKLVIVLDRQSRYDVANNRPLAGPAGDLVSDVEHVAIYRDQPLPAGTTHVLCSGFCKRGPLEQERGYVTKTDSGLLIQHTYFAQDCMDRKDYESGSDDDDDDDRDGTGKDRAPTSRQNYRFWFRRDLAKLMATTPETWKSGRVEVGEGATPQDMAAWLHAQKGQTLFFDIESHPPSNTMQCFSIAAERGPVMSFTVYNYNGKLAYGALEVLAELTKAMQRNKMVIHNSLFDLLFMAHYHGIPFGRDNADTMLMHHRLYPEAEKSLAHCISLYINAPYHKDEAGTFTPHNFQQQRKLLRYNAIDVLRLRQIYAAMMAHNPEALPSIQQVNESIYPYAMASMTGIAINMPALRAARDELNRKAMQLCRIAKHLVGQPINLGSGKQVANYLYTGMGYPVIARTDAGEPATSSDALYRLQLKVNNPMLQLILAHKSIAKEASMLGFMPYIRHRKR